MKESNAMDRAYISRELAKVDQTRADRTAFWWRCVQVPEDNVAECKEQLKFLRTVFQKDLDAINNKSADLKMQFLLDISS